MKAIGLTTTGGPDVLEVLDLPDPAPGEGELLVRVHAAAVNPTDTTRRAGTSRRPAGDMPLVPGMDVAGILEEIGPDTQTTLKVGDRVMGIVVPSGTHGAYAEKVVLPADSVVAAPRDTSHALAASLPMNGLTARLALDTLALPRGGVVAVSGAAGAMGGYVVQLAKADGLTVVADAADKDEELVRELGADVVLPRGDDFADRVRERYPEGVDGAVDGALLDAALAPAVKDGATIVTVRGYDEKADRGVTFAPIFVGDYAQERAKLDQLRKQAESGTVTLRVAAVLSKEEAPEAHRRLEAGGVRGRIVLAF
ncbi:NADP-dependent oxidoreductase [Georgenia sp. Z1344]|uniref:NADP-dependent oxidoreductase n=1 Tax=Georgenia sp. Z1344 TaxID=3416706 RepID=UPI003CED6664